MCCPGADRFGGESNAFATRQADAAARDITRALDPVMEVPIGFSHFRPPPFDLGRIILGDILDPLHDHFIEGYIAALQIAGIP